MFLSRFAVKNYKCLGDIDIPLTPIHVLIGQNDAGKTSLLEALAAFHGSGEKPLAEVFPEPWEGTDLVRHGCPTFDVDFAGTWTPLPHESESRETRYGVAVTFPLLGRESRNCGGVGRGPREITRISRAAGNQRRSIALDMEGFQVAGNLASWAPPLLIMFGRCSFAGSTRKSWPSRGP